MDIVSEIWGGALNTNSKIALYDQDYCDGNIEEEEEEEDEEDTDEEEEEDDDDIDFDVEPFRTPTRFRSRVSRLRDSRRVDGIVGPCPTNVGQPNRFSLPISFLRGRQSWLVD